MSSFRFGKIAFLAEKAISFRFGKIAFSGRQVARNCMKVVLAPRESVPFQDRKNCLFRRKIWKNRFFRSPRRSKLRQGCSGAVKKLVLSDSESRFLRRKKRFLSGSEKSLSQVVKPLEIASTLF